MSNNAEFFIYMDEEERKPREMVIYTIPQNICSWPTEKIVFFQSSGSSNVNSAWLSNTFFPTNGLSCHVENTDNNVNIFNKYNVHTGLENMKHVHGHIIKLSDYNNFLKNKEKGTFTNSYYEFKALEEFNRFLINKLIYFVTDKDFINTNKDLIILNREKYGQYSYYLNLLKAIRDYFSCEEQIKISYSLSNNNEGLWSWEFCGITFVDICKERWGELPPKIEKIPAEDITKDYLNTDETYNYLASKSAITDFDYFLTFIKENELFFGHRYMSEFLNKYNQPFMISNSQFIVKKALDYKKQEEKMLQQLVTLPPPPPPSLPQPEPMELSSTEIVLPPPPPPHEQIQEELYLTESFRPSENKKYRRRRTSVKKEETAFYLIGEKKIKESKRERQRRISLRRNGTRLKMSKGGYRSTHKLKKKHK